MATPGSTEATVLAALEVLYQKHLQPEQVQAADAYLRAFQVTPEAFNVAVSLLDRCVAQCQQHPEQLPTVSPVLFFASQTLATKIRRQHVLPVGVEWSFAAWCEKIVAWLAALPSSMPKLVPTQLSLALVACVPRMTSEELASKAQQQTNGVRAGSAIGFLLHLLSSAQVASGIVAEVLVVVAEELSDLQEREARDRMQRELDDWASMVLDQVLPQLMQDAMQSSTSTKELVLRAARAWIRFARVPATVVVQNALMQSLIVFLRDDELFDVAVELIVELVRCFPDVQHDIAVVQWLVPQLMQLQGDFQQAAKDQDSDKCLGLCRIFTEMGESYLDLLVGDQAMDQAIILDLLLDCMQYPDAEVAGVTTSFWFRFLGACQHESNKHSAPKFQAHIIRLAGICMQNLQFDEDFPTLPSDKQQDFKGFRQELGDLLRECCDVLGVESILTHCVQGLQAIYQLPASQRRWEAVEAHLYCVRSIGRNVENAASNSQLVASPLETIFQHLPQFAEHPAIKYTACLIVSRYALWLRDHGQFLTPLVEFLHQCVVGSAQDTLAANWQVSSAAATALRTLAIDCWPTLGADVLRFYLYIDAQGEGAMMGVDDHVLMLQGIFAGVSQTRDTNAMLQVLDQVLSPILRRLTAVYAASASGERVNSTIAMQELLRILSIYDYLEVHDRRSQSQPLVLLTERVWTSLDQMLSLFRASDELVERVCRCYKRMLKTGGVAIKPFVPRMVENLLSFYQTEPKSSYLYAASMVLKYFYNDQSTDMTPLLANMLLRLAEMTFPLFKSVERMQSLPDILEEFFYLMERGVRMLPQALVNEASKPTLMAQVLRGAVLALQFSHNDANKAALCFLELVYQRAVTSGTPDPVAAALERIVQESFASTGRELVDCVLRAVVLGVLPRYRVDDDYGSVAGLLVHVAKLNGAALQQWLQEWFHQAVATQTVVFLSDRDIARFESDLFGSSSEREFRRVIRHFARLCASRTESSGGQGRDSR
ncbi:hypothetical protein Poli38472_014379 [Pythium oligandrum]|uniref:Exportin-1/Importin-beta-like domain-containing protein n=1 Tax=Pythium oligandrum TaxID=41045 RepID=A0A8K1C7D0_PYTOL|nr:hypothetical protein Poli38472_014379 [Pythium oligandrum]|eukprot:TMW57776.1 hypothetical protein Poli38472_014379 [Pythium oligandrum]